MTAKEFRRFNSETVPLARLTKRVFSTADPFEVDLEIAHFGEKPIENAVPYWRIIDEKGLVAGGPQMLPARTIPIGKNISLGKVTARF